MRPNRQNTAHMSFIFISRNPLIGYDFAAIKSSVVKCAPLVEADHSYNTNSQHTNNYPIHISAEASNLQNTAHETSLLESFIFISTNPLIGNDFAAIKSSVVKCARIAVDMNISFSHLFNITIAYLAKKLLLSDF